MRFRPLSKLISFFILTTLLEGIFAMPMTYASATIVKVSPSPLTVAFGSSFDVDVTITNVANLTGWSFKLYYLNAILNCTGITEGPFLRSLGLTFHVFNVEGNYNATHGRVLAACSLLGVAGSASGSGVLATLTFKALGSGSTFLNFTDTQLSDNEFPHQPIPHTVVGGAVTVALLTSVGVSPAIVTAIVGDTITTDITITNVANLTGWSFKLYYLNTVLNCTNVFEGIFLRNTTRSTYSTFNIVNDYNSTHGCVLAASVILGNTTGSASGSGVLTTLTFKALGSGSTFLNFTDTQLSDNEFPRQPILHTSTDGAITVFLVPPINVDPPASTVAFGSIFSVNVSVLCVSNLTGWSLELYYLNAILNCTGIVEGPFLNSVGGTFSNFNIANNYNSTHGCVLAACALLGTTNCASGSGVLATLTFKALGSGSTFLNFTDTQLSDNEFPRQPILHTSTDGAITVFVNTSVKVDPSYLTVIFGSSFSLNISVISVTSLSGWAFKLYYKKSILNCTGAVEGFFLRSAGNTSSSFSVVNNFNSTHGCVIANSSLLGTTNSANGTGVLATLAFRVLATYTCSTPLDLNETSLSSRENPAQPIPHSVIDGTVIVSYPSYVGGTIYIRSDGSVYPTTAPLLSSDNVTYTLMGNITSDANGIVVEKNDVVLNGAGFVIMGTGSNLTSYLGIELTDKSNVTVKNVEIRSFWCGIFTNTSLANTFQSNVLVNNTISIALLDSSNNYINKNSLIQSDTGIFISRSSNNNIARNLVSEAGVGISLANSSYNMLLGNNVTNNNEGFEFTVFSNNNELYGNFIVLSGFSGISIYSSSDNLVYHNSFIKNLHNVFGGNVTDSSNIWDNGCEGNYWSDFNVTDSNHDGIGDSAYLIDVSNRDSFPLINPYWNQGDINHDLTVDVKDVYLCALAYGTSATGPNPQSRHWNPHCDTNEDSRIDIKDYYIVCRNYGQVYVDP